MPIIPVPRRQKPEDFEFEISLGYIVRLFLQKPTTRDAVQW
jgi:hypothetical protein